MVRRSGRENFSREQNKGLRFGVEFRCGKLQKRVWRAFRWKARFVGYTGLRELGITEVISEISNTREFATL
jgi:hypothetical protein